MVITPFLSNKIVYELKRDRNHVRTEHQIRLFIKFLLKPVEGILGFITINSSYPDCKR